MLSKSQIDWRPFSDDCDHQFAQLYNHALCAVEEGGKLSDQIDSSSTDVFQMLVFVTDKLVTMRVITDLESGWHPITHIHDVTKFRYVGWKLDHEVYELVPSKELVMVAAEFARRHY